MIANDDVRQAKKQAATDVTAGSLTRVCRSCGVDLIDVYVVEGSLAACGLKPSVFVERANALRGVIPALKSMEVPIAVVRAYTIKTKSYSRYFLSL